MWPGSFLLNAARNQRGAAPPDVRSRRIRSYVLRDGRVTQAQAAALETLWPRYGRPVDAFAGDPHAAFGRRAPLYLEIGTGNGDNFVAAAAADPGSSYLGCEVHRAGLGHALLGLHDRQIDNALLVAGDAVELLGVLPGESLAGVSLFFPDPWPKKRHHKRRLVQAGFLDLLASRLERSGVLRFATDDEGYAQAVLDLLERVPGWVNLAGERCFAPRPQCRVVTRFEHRALTAGRRVRDLVAGVC